MQTLQSKVNKLRVYKKLQQIARYTAKKVVKCEVGAVQAFQPYCNPIQSITISLGLTESKHMKASSNI